MEAQPPGPNFAEVDRVLEEATAALHRLKQQHFLTSARPRPPGVEPPLAAKTWGRGWVQVDEAEFRD